MLHDQLALGLLIQNLRLAVLHAGDDHMRSSRHSVRQRSQDRLGPQFVDHFDIGACPQRLLDDFERERRGAEGCHARPAARCDEVLSSFVARHADTFTRGATVVAATGVSRPTQMRARARRVTLGSSGTPRSVRVVGIGGLVCHGVLLPWLET